MDYISLLLSAKRLRIRRYSSSSKDPIPCPLHDWQENKQIRLDVQEHDLLYIIVADMPGVDKQDIMIRFFDTDL